MAKAWIPEISYESDDDDNQLGSMPLIHVPTEEKMPTFLMVWEARDTGEIEPGPSGEEVPVVDWELRQFARMDVLKEKLAPDEFDRVRLALGLSPLAEATAKGKEISQRVRENVAQREMARLGKKL